MTTPWTNERLEKAGPSIDAAIAAGLSAKLSDGKPLDEVLHVPDSTESLERFVCYVRSEVVAPRPDAPVGILTAQRLDARLDDTFELRAETTIPWSKLIVASTDNPELPLAVAEEIEAWAERARRSERLWAIKALIGAAQHCDADLAGDNLPSVAPERGLRALVLRKELEDAVAAVPGLDEVVLVPLRDPSIRVVVFDPAELAWLRIEDFQPEWQRQAAGLHLAVTARIVMRNLPVNPSGGAIRTYTGVVTPPG